MNRIWTSSRRVDPIEIGNLIWRNRQAVTSVPSTIDGARHIAQALCGTSTTEVEAARNFQYLVFSYKEQNAFNIAYGLSGNKATVVMMRPGDKHWALSAIITGITGGLGGIAGPFGKWLGSLAGAGLVHKIGQPRVGLWFENGIDKRAEQLLEIHCEIGQD